MTAGREFTIGRSGGGLVPYGKVWRTGANENTTISFLTAVSVDGHELPAGMGLQTIPAESGDWTIIFSKDAELWGAFDYKEDHDALRVQAKALLGRARGAHELRVHRPHRDLGRRASPLGAAGRHH